MPSCMNLSNPPNDPTPPPCAMCLPEIETAKNKKNFWVKNQPRVMTNNATLIY